MKKVFLPIYQKSKYCKYSFSIWIFLETLLWMFISSESNLAMNIGNITNKPVYSQEKKRVVSDFFLTGYFLFNQNFEHGNWLSRFALNA